MNWLESINEERFSIKKIGSEYLGNKEMKWFTNLHPQKCPPIIKLNKGLQQNTAMVLICNTKEYVFNKNDNSLQ